MLGSQSAAAFAVPALSRSPLHDLHQKLGARLVEFAGYCLPLNYPSGIISEHLFTRASAGLFDVSHMGQAVLFGPNAARRLETLVPGEIATLTPGQMRYTLLLDADGHILDDLIVTRLADEGGCERLFLVVNASRKEADFAHIAGGLADCTLSVLEDHALIALQGPMAAGIVCRHVPSNSAKMIASMPFMSAQSFARDGVALHVSRSGYTGEDGFEISLSAASAQDIAQELLGHQEVRPIGLGARDSLRLEAGLCLYGHDIDATTGPIEAGLLWTISKRRREEGGFLGHAQVEKTIENGPSRRRVGFLIEGKVLAREGATIMANGGQRIGQITSGGFAPSLGQPIAMGYVDAAFAMRGTQVAIEARGKQLSARIVPLPFVPHRYFGGS
jgi:aminomethyltransferase